jgi:GntR family transcriptional repressor for pyruvate dehydrogenase complex
MPLHAIRSRSLSEQVFEQLAAEIITGRYSPGSNLPAERTLTTVFDVNRHVVREALKRLEQVGLVKVSQGGGTRVLDFMRHAGLDLLALMSEHARAGEDVGAIWLAAFEMRAVIAADIARLCALRGSLEVKQELLAIAHEMKASTSDEQTFALDVRFWQRMAEGAGNIAYRLALNTMVRSAEAKGAVAAQWTVNEVKAHGFRLPVAEAIAQGDGAKAEAMTRDSMREGLDALAAMLGKAPNNGQTGPAVPPPAAPPGGVAEKRTARSPRASGPKG